jgi:hypothetical protein
MTDAQLFSLLDGDTPSSGFPAAHLGTCAECADRLRVMRLRWSRLGALLEATDAPLGGVLPPTLAELRRHRARGSRGSTRYPPWAAGIALVIAAGVMASPLRAWVVDWVSDHWAAVAGSAARSPRTPPAPIVVEQGLYFPAGRELVLDFDAPQTEGEVIVSRGDATDVYVGLRSRGAVDPVQLTPSGLRVRNRMESAVSYRLVLPAHVAVFHLRVAGRTAATRQAEELRQVGERLRIGR